MKPPFTFRPDPDVEAALDRDAASRPGVPRSFIVNEALRFALRHPRSARSAISAPKRPARRATPSVVAA